MSFALKRGHLSATRFGRQLFEQSKDEELADVMTPARYDILALLHGNTSSAFDLYRNYAMTQAELRERLGVRASTVSEIVKRLVELELVRKGRYRQDGRTRLLRLTDRGLAAIRRAFQLVHGGRRLARAFDDVAHEASVAKQPPQPAPKRKPWRVVPEPRRRPHLIRRELARLVAMTSRLARAVGDRVANIHPLRIRPLPSRPKKSHVHIPSGWHRSHRPPSKPDTLRYDPLAPRVVGGPMNPDDPNDPWWFGGS